jgi:hypothetical protein
MVESFRRPPHTKGDHFLAHNFGSVLSFEAIFPNVSPEMITAQRMDMHAKCRSTIRYNSESQPMNLVMSDSVSHTPTEIEA